MGAKGPHSLPIKGVTMNDLKKYKVVKDFNGYRAGITVAFNGADAEKYAAFIVSKDKPAVVAVCNQAAEQVAETVAEQPVKKTVKRVKKGRK